MLQPVNVTLIEYANIHPSPKALVTTDKFIAYIEVFNLLIDFKFPNNMTGVYWIDTLTLPSSMTSSAHQSTL